MESVSLKICEKLKLERNQSELDFVDIDLDNDTALFLDPYFLPIQRRQVVKKGS